MKYQVNINGIDVEAYYSDDFINGIAKPLLKLFTNMYRKSNKRIVVFLAAPPASGKSTLVSFLEKLSIEDDSLENIEAIGMDGFHHYQDYLLSHDTVRDGKTIKMVDIKGAPITFDLEELTNRIKMLRYNKECWWPIYDRMLHNPKDNSILVKGNIVLLEGNYLLLNDDGWRDLRKYCDYSIFIKADVDELKKRLVDRKMVNVKDYDKALQFVEYSDLYNARLILKNSSKADLVLKLRNDDYCVEEGTIMPDELKDEELEKVTGGIYNEEDGPLFDIGDRFQVDNTYFYEISRFVGFSSFKEGYSYEVMKLTIVNPDYSRPDYLELCDSDLSKLTKY